MIYKVSQDGVMQLILLSQSLSFLMNQLKESFIKMYGSIEKYIESGGPHSKEILEMARSAGTAISNMEAPIAEIENSIKELAETYLEIISFLLIQNSSTGKEVSASGKTVSFGGSGASFCSLPLDHKDSQSGRGSYNVIGLHHDGYMEVYDHTDNYKYETFDKEKAYVQTVPADQIEGIQLSEHDVEFPDSFWSQHDSTGTLSSFLEIAAKVPAVKEKLNQGIPLSDIMNDTELGKCAHMYFSEDINGMPRVTEVNGSYEFDGNGRHRIMAARLLGLEIPVLITGRYTHR